MYEPTLNLDGEFLGHGIDDDGRVYEGWLVNGEVHYYFADTGEESFEH